MEEMVAGECLIRSVCKRTIPAGMHAESDMRAREVLDVGMPLARVRVQALMRASLLPCLLPHEVLPAYTLAAR